MVDMGMRLGYLVAFDREPSVESVVKMWYYLLCYLAEVG